MGGGGINDENFREGDDFKVGEMDEACRTQERQEKFVRNIGGIT